MLTSFIQNTFQQGKASRTCLSIQAWQLSWVKCHQELQSYFVHRISRRSGIMELVRVEKTSRIMESPSTAKATTKPHPQVLHPHGFSVPPWMGPPPLPWAAHGIVGTLRTLLKITTKILLSIKKWVIIGYKSKHKELNGKWGKRRPCSKLLTSLQDAFSKLRMVKPTRYQI